MSLPRWLVKLHFLKLGFLLLPLLLIAFGLCGETLTNQVLRGSYVALDKLQADNSQPKVQFSVSVLVIAVEIEKERNITNVELNTTNSILKKLEFELPVTELSMVKAMISQELGLSPEQRRMLVSYRVKN